MSITRVNEIRVSIILKILSFHSFKASGSTVSRLHQRLLKSFKAVAISLRHLGKSILEGNLYLGPLEIMLRSLASGMTFRLPVKVINKGFDVLYVLGTRYLNFVATYILSALFANVFKANLTEPGK